MSKVTLIALLAVVLLTGCGAGGPGTAGPSSPPPASSKPPPAGQDQPVSQWCMGAGENTDGVEQKLVTTGSGAEVMTMRVGTGPVTALLVHQTNGKGACGFLFFAQQLARSGVSAVTVDACGYGRSDCPSDDTPAVLAELANQARDEGAERVVLVGASMGGSLVTMAGPGAKADAVVNLSGPATFGPADLERDAPLVTMPLLVVQSGEDIADLDATRKIWDKIPAKRKQLVKQPNGHGYDFLRSDDPTKPTTGGRTVIDWVLKG
ncbi:MAG: lysophospholipase [Propionibacteriales bacterium]|nr:lysophospholipase [Propionibacteriales bacterium]